MDHQLKIIESDIKKRLGISEYEVVPQNRKIFVGGLPEGISDEEFESYFAKFGNITDHVVIHDKYTKKPRGFGFVSFDSDEAVNAVLQNQYHILKNKQVEVIKAKPKQALIGVSQPYSHPPQQYYDNNYYYFPQQDGYYYYQNCYDGAIYPPSYYNYNYYSAQDYPTGNYVYYYPHFFPS